MLTFTCVGLAVVCVWLVWALLSEVLSDSEWRKLTLFFFIRSVSLLYVKPNMCVFVREGLVCNVEIPDSVCLSPGCGVLCCSLESLVSAAVKPPDCPLSFLSPACETDHPCAVYRLWGVFSDLQWEVGWWRSPGWFWCFGRVVGEFQWPLELLEGHGLL